MDKRHLSQCRDVQFYFALYWFPWMNVSAKVLQPWCTFGSMSSLQPRDAAGCCLFQLLLLIATLHWILLPRQRTPKCCLSQCCLYTGGVGTNTPSLTALTDVRLQLNTRPRSLLNTSDGRVRAGFGSGQGLRSIRSS